MLKSAEQHRLFEAKPRATLRPFIRRFLVLEFSAPHHDVHLPDVSTVAAFSFRGRCRLDGGQRVPAAAFTGLRETLRTHAHDDGHAVLLAIFTPVGAAAFLRPPQEALAGATTHLADVLANPEELERLQELLAFAPNHSRRIALIENFLLARLCNDKPDTLVSAAVDWLGRQTGTITELTRYIGLSQSALERRFRRIVGLTPKKFAALVRRQRAVRLHGAGADFTTVAQDAGYFDQSHFIHDFRRMTGRAPEVFFREATARNADFFQSPNPPLR